MADFTALAATAKRLIDANGRAVVIIKQGTTPQDVDQPWRGQADYPQASVSGLAVFVSKSDLGKKVENADGFKQAQKVALFAAADDEGELLETFDVLSDEGVEWKIVHAEVLQPGDTRLLYLFGVSR